MDIFRKQFEEVILSVLPITALVIVLSFTVVPIPNEMLIRFIIGALLLTLGLGIFLFGATIGVSDIGNLMGETIAKSNNAFIVWGLGFLLGFLITIAEPDMQILAHQVHIASGGVVPGTLTLAVVALGVGVMVGIGLLRILFGKPLNKTFAVAYFLMFLLGLGVTEEFLAISVDSSGATTGAMTTPFILALGYGVSRLKGGKTAEEDSFGMVGMASAGPILAVMLMSLILRLRNIQGDPEAFTLSTGILGPYLRTLPRMAKESVFTLLPLTVLFLIFDKVKFKLNRRHKSTILKGLVYTYVGLTLFLTGVNAGFMEVGRVMGEGIALNHPWLLPVLGFFLGMVVVLAEPAVHVLTIQVEEVTAGHIKRKVILIALSAGIALAVSMAMLRIMIPNLRLWHILLPGFAFAAFLSFRVPPIFVGIAYDSGGVASGPMTATFVLAFAQGAANAIPTADVMVDGFGIIAVVAMTPLVAIQLLGLIFKRKAEREAKREAQYSYES